MRAAEYVLSWLLLSCHRADLLETSQLSQIFHKPSTSPQKRKRGQEQEAEHLSSQSQERPPSKRLHTSPLSHINEKTSHQTPASDISEGSTDPLRHWIKTGKWPKEYFEQDSKVIEDFERGKSSEDLQEPYIEAPFLDMDSFNHLHGFVAVTKSLASLRRKQSQSTVQTPSDQLSREAKSSQYNSPDYAIRLAQKGSYMHEYDDINKENHGQNMKTVCKTLLERDQTVPQDSLFRDDLFEKTCEKVRDRNEAIIVQDISRLIVPSAMNLAIYGAKHLNHLYETVNESWTSMAQYEGTLPQPDYSVGFGQSAFTREQLDKLKPFVGEPGFKFITYFMATTRMYFPFFTCEVKCGAVGLDAADRQNAQSMSVALRALNLLFQFAKRAKELDREILTFSVSHDNALVRIYGHYSVIEGDKTNFYRHLVRRFDITDGEQKWTAYKFTKSVYDIHMPKLHKLICSAIDDLPDINFDLSQSASSFQSPPQSSQPSNAKSVLDKDDSRWSFPTLQEITPTTSFTQRTEPAFKKPKNKAADD